MIASTQSKNVQARQRIERRIVKAALVIKGGPGGQYEARDVNLYALMTVSKKGGVSAASKTDSARTARTKNVNNEIAC